MYISIYFNILWCYIWWNPRFQEKCSPTQTIEIRGFTSALLFNGHFKLYTNVKIHETLRKFFDLWAGFSKISYKFDFGKPMETYVRYKKHAQSSWLSTGENRSSLSHFILELFKKQSHSWIFWTTPTFISKKDLFCIFGDLKSKSYPLSYLWGFILDFESPRNLKWISPDMKVVKFCILNLGKIPNKTLQIWKRISFGF